MKEAVTVLAAVTVRVISSCPEAFMMVRVTLYVPAEAKVWLGF